MTTIASLVILPRDARRAWLTSHNALEALRTAGHCAFKAQEILLDATRGDRFALSWILSTLGESDDPLPALLHPSPSRAEAPV